MTNATRALVGLTAAVLLSVGGAAHADTEQPRPPGDTPNVTISEGDCRIGVHVREFSDTQWIVVGYLVRDGQRYLDQKLVLQRDDGRPWVTVASAVTSEPDGKVVFVVSPVPLGRHPLLYRLSYAGDSITSPCASRLFYA